MTGVLSVIYFACLASTTRSVNVFRRNTCPFSTWENLFLKIISKSGKIFTGSPSRKSNIRSWSFMTWEKNMQKHVSICGRGRGHQNKFQIERVIQHPTSNINNSTSSPFCQPPPSSISRMPKCVPRIRMYSKLIRKQKVSSFNWVPSLNWFSFNNTSKTDV